MKEDTGHFFTDLLSNALLTNVFNNITNNLLLKSFLTLYLLFWMFCIKFIIGKNKSSSFLVDSISTWIYFLAAIVILFCKNEDPKLLY